MEKHNTYTPENYDKLIAIVKDILYNEYDEEYARVLIAKHGLYENYSECADKEKEDCPFCTTEDSGCERWVDWITLHGEEK